MSETKYCHEYAIVTKLRETANAMHVSTPDDAKKYWMEHVATSPAHDPGRETLVVLLLNTRGRMIGHHVVAIGTINSIVVDTKIVLKAAILANASAIVLMHNHPSGCAAPSSADITVTRRVRDAAKIMDITLQDHVIVGTEGNPDCRAGRYSLREAGNLQ